MTTQKLFNDKQAKKIWYDLAYGKGKISRYKSTKIFDSRLGLGIGSGTVKLSNFHPFIEKNITTLSTLLSDRRGITGYIEFTDIVLDYLSNGKLSLDDITILMSDEMLDCYCIINLISNKSIPIEVLIDDDYYVVDHIENLGLDKKQVADIRERNLNLRIKEVTFYLEAINPEVDLQSLPADFALGLIGIKQGLE